MTRIPDRVVVVTVKRVSGKEVHCDVNPKNADRSIRHETVSGYWREYGKRWKFRYRLNIYLKGSDNEVG